MRKISSSNQFPEKVPAILSSKALTSAPDSDHHENYRKSNRRKIRNPGFSGAGVRLKKEGASLGRRSGPATPLLRWKYDDGDVPVSVVDNEVREAGEKVRRKVRNIGHVSVSARKLAAALWQLPSPEIPAGGGGYQSLQIRSSDRLGYEPGVVHLGLPNLCNHNSREYGYEGMDIIQCPFPVSGRKNEVSYKLDPSQFFPNSAMEGATKWDPGYSKTSEKVFQIYSHMKLMEDQQVTTVSVVSTLQAELEQARTRIQELETERKSSKKKLEHFLKKLAEEKASWRSREHEKTWAIIDDAKIELNREKKNHQKLEIVNFKLVNELEKAKLSAKRFMQEYEKERRKRELMEEVCEELANEIGEDRAEVEALKRESMKFRDEVEEERKMLQLAEVWREERVQMKLVDAKLTLEEKYSHLNKLLAYLEAFQKSRSATPDVMEMREIEFLREAINSVNIQDIKEFSYEPSNSEDIFPVFEELQPCETIEKEIEPCLTDRPSNVHTPSPEGNGFSKTLVQRHSNGFINYNGEIEEDGSDWETVSHTDDQDSSYSPEGSDPSINRIRRESNVSGSGTEWEGNVGNDTPNTEISEVFSELGRQSKKKKSSISRLWRSCPSNGTNYKIISIDGMNGKPSNRRISNGGTLSPDRISSEDGLSPASLVEQWSSPDSGKSYLSRGMKGCIEWPREIQENRLKAKLLEARMHTHKIQIRHVLKQKI